MSCLLEISVIVIQCELWTDNNDMGEEKVINLRRESTSYAETNYAKPMMVAEVRQYMKHRNKESALLYKLFYIVSVDCFSKVCG